MKIAVIGNGACALNTLTGDIIDRCDHIVRLGNFVISGYEKFVGGRTTIIGTTRRKIDNIHLANLIWYVEDMTSQENSDMIRNLKYTDDMSIYSYRPTIGTRILQKVLDTFEPAEVYVKGFDFLSTGWYWNQEHSYGAVSHPTILEKIYYRKLIRGKKIIEI